LRLHGLIPERDCFTITKINIRLISAAMRVAIKSNIDRVINKIDVAHVPN